MRIAVISDAWYPQINGVVRTLDTTRAELEAMGHQVNMITPDQFTTIPAPSYPEIRLAIWPWGKMKRKLIASQPDAVHIATEGPLGHAARRFCLNHGVPFTTAFHTRFPEYLHARWRIPLSWSYAYMRRFHAKAAGCMVSTPSLMREMAERGFGRLMMFSRGVDLELFHPRQAEHPPGELAGLPRPFQVYVGRVAVEKNLRAFLECDTPGTKIIVGDGPQVEELSKAFPDAVFAGPRRGEDLARWYAAGDVFVFPSKTDTFGLVMLEALACGVPVAAFPVQGPLDVVGPNSIGAIAQEKAVACLDENLTSAIERAIGLSPRACRQFAEDYSWRACATQFQNNLAEFTTLPLDAAPMPA